MNETDDFADDRDELDEVIAAYLDQPVSDRARNRRMWIEQFPQFRDELRAFFDQETELRAFFQGHSEPISPEFDLLEHRYQLERLIGHGSSGTVYRAQDLESGHPVAVKLLLATSLIDAEESARFWRGVEAGTRLKHPNIVPVLDTGEVQGRPFLVMPLIDAPNLRTVFGALNKSSREGASLEFQVTRPGFDVPAGTLNTMQSRWRGVALCGLQVAEALAHAHSHGVIHRDIKPSNLMLDDQGKVHVTDLGTAQAGTNEEQTSSSELVGTLAYLAPERFHGWCDPRSDVYSLGLVLYELLTLQPVFRDSDRFRLIRRILHEEPPAPRRLNSAIPRDLETIILKAIAKEPSGRYESAAELAMDLQRWLDGKRIVARRENTVRQMAILGRRNPTVAALACGLLATMLLGLGGVSIAWREAVHQRNLFRQANREIAREHDQKERQRIAAEISREAAIASELKARQSEELANAMNHFFNEHILMQANLDDDGSNRDLSLLEALDRAEAKVSQEFASLPATEAGIRKSLGTAYHSLGAYRRSAKNLERALSLYRSEKSLSDRELFALEVLHAHVVSHIDPDRSKQLRILQELHSRAKSMYGVDSIDAARTGRYVADQLVLTQNTYEELIKNAKTSEEILKQIIPHLRGTDPGIITERLLASNQLGNALRLQEKIQEAVGVFEDSFQEAQQRFGPSSSIALSMANNLGTAYQTQGRHAEAGKIFAETLPHVEKIYGPNHPNSISVVFNLGFIEAATGHLSEAGERFQECLNRMAQSNDPDMILKCETLNALGAIFQSSQRLEEARTAWNQSLELHQKLWGDNHPRTNVIRERIASLP